MLTRYSPALWPGATLFKNRARRPVTAHGQERFDGAMQRIRSGFVKGQLRDSPLLMRAGLMVAIALYLTYETGRYHLIGIPLPVLVAAVVVTFLLAWTQSARLELEVRSVRRLAAILAVIALVGFTTYAAFHVLDGYALLPDWVVDDAARTADAVFRVRIFDGSLVYAVAVAGIGLLLGASLGASTQVRPGLTHALAAIALAMMAVQDLVFFQTAGLRDLRLDMRAGALFDHGQSPYLAAVLHVMPADQTLLPFVYPPVTLPFFGTLADLPFPLVAVAWTVGSLVAMVVGLRVIGLGWTWVALLLLWPAVAQGLYVGNVAVPAFLLFAAAPRFGAGLVLGGIAKLQSAIPALSLVRERRWSALALGVVVLISLCALTLPFVGMASWSAWIAGLGFYQASAQLLPGLYGMALPGIVPFPIYVALATLATVAAMRVRDLAGLARLGLATIVASPSLYSHGFLVGLASFLRLRPFWFWMVLALTSTVLGPGWWIAVVIGIGGWYALPLQRGPIDPDGAFHPLGRRPEPWHAWADGRPQ